MRRSRGGRRTGGEGRVKEVTSVTRVVEFRFEFVSVSESESSAHDAADVAASFDGPETGGSSALTGKAVISAVSRAM